jgi:hypothetical protein
MHEKPRGTTFMPKYLVPAHELCLLHHDVLVELLRSGQEQKVFDHKFRFRDEQDRQTFAEAGDVFGWLERTNRTEDRTAFLRRIIFPAILSDFLHFIFEALETSRKAKLNVTYALLRKPLQENLFIFEVMAASPALFARHLSENPLLLRGQKTGGLETHAQRISAALQVLNEEDRFDSGYLAQLRYDISVDDGFNGSCNKAIHLFTSHHAIQTEPLNVNFVFSDWDAKLTQWYFLYSRLPYVLFYARRLVEHICSTFARTDPVYVADMERRAGAGTILWARNIEERYRQPMIDRFVEATRIRLSRECRAAGYREPRFRDLARMLKDGAFPGEPKLWTTFRGARYSAAALRRRFGRALRRRRGAA